MKTVDWQTQNAEGHVYEDGSVWVEQRSYDMQGFFFGVDEIAEIAALSAARARGEDGVAT